MFAMFFYLSQYIQNVMGYSPLQAGVAFLPFCVGIVVGRGISSNLVNRIDPRYLAGVGTLMAAAALYGFSRLPYDTTAPGRTDVTRADYVTDLLPFILLMSFGMGLTFVPLTLTAVHHLRSEDSGIGSGVLNTMQQVGGALGPRHAGTVAAALPPSRPGGPARQRPPGQPPARAAAADRAAAAADAADRCSVVHRGRDPRVPRRRGR